MKNIGSIAATVDYSQLVRSLEVIKSPLQLTALLAIVAVIIIIIVSVKFSPTAAAIIGGIALAILAGTIFLVLAPNATTGLKCETPKTPYFESGSELVFQPSPCDRLLEFKADTAFENQCGRFRGPKPFQAEVNFSDTGGRKRSYPASTTNRGKDLHLIISGKVQLPKNTGAWIELSSRGNECAIRHDSPQISVLLQDSQQGKK